MKTPARLEVTDGTTLTITWDDGVVQRMSAQRLRDACSCADCRAGPKRGASALRLVDPVPATIADAQLVGGYGVNLTFAPDGHRTGIFSYEQLRSIGS